MFIWYIKFYYVNRTKMNGVLVKNLFPRSLHFLFIVVYHECHNVWLKVMYFSFFFFSSRTTQIAISAFLDTFQKVADMATGSRGNWYLIYLFLLFFHLHSQITFKNSCLLLKYDWVLKSSQSGPLPKIWSKAQTSVYLLNFIF